jgi:thiamine-phosphate pyrophosphorylase
MKPNAALARFYPIVPDADWVERIVPLGVGMLQIRMKGREPNEVKSHLRRALTACKKLNCQLIVNDHWREAIEVGADYIHLGQEDLESADLPTIRHANIRIGISTHDDDELIKALAADADYIALGPIYETKLKAMRWEPQGLARVSEWKTRIGSKPLVAIGGITPERATGVLEAGADSLAVITDFMSHPDPDARIVEWLRWANEYPGIIWR